MKQGVLLSFLTFFIFTELLCQQANWQQKVDYEINVKLYPETKTLDGDITINYLNNSPNTLNSIWFHIWPNAYKNDETAFAKQFIKNGNVTFHFSTPEEKGYITKLKFKSGNDTLSWSFDKNNIDIIEVKLNKPLEPNQSIVISTPFLVKLPKLFSRSGFEKGFFAATQWYPKPAVYDIKGWNTMPYLDQGEFYSEFGNFKVNISVPENYMVAATGNLESQSEIDNINHYKLGANRFKVKTYKTLTYSENHVHDFAWFADTCFSINKSKIKLNNGDTVNTWLFYSRNSSRKIFFKGDIMKPINYSVSSYSKKVGNYPYKNCTVVIGPLKAGGGMEYPTITICDSYNTGIINHEVGHNWFQGMLGTNERQYPWMDESINTFFEEDYATDSTFFNDFNPNKWSYRYEDLSNYLYSFKQGLAQPLNIPSDSFTDLNYGCIVYGKGPVLFSYLKEKLGDSMFSNCIKNYFKAWQYKHPLPKDMQQSFERTSGQNLDWFFIELLNENNTIDYIKRGKNSKLKNAPLLDKYLKENKVQEVSIGGYLPERNYNNNGQRSKLLNVHIPWKQPIYNRTIHLNMSPIMGFNYYDKMYLGAAIFNRTIFRNKWEYIAMPAYAIGSKKLVGYGKLNYMLLPSHSSIYKIEVGIQGQSFSMNTLGFNNQYFRINPYLKMNFKHKGIPNDNVINELILNFYHIGLINQTFSVRDSNNNQLVYRYNANNFMNYYKAAYHLENKHKINNYGITLNSEFGNNYKFDPLQNQYLKTWLTAKYHYQYAKNKYLKSEILAGIFLFKKGSIGIQQFYISGNNGNMDYLYNEALLGRNESFFSDNILGRQLINNATNMRNIAQIAGGNNDKWLLSSTNEISLPGKIPFNIYADFTYAQTTTYNGNTNSIDYNKAELFTTMGISISLFKNNLQLFAPIFQSKQFDALKNNGYKFTDFIGFKLNMNALNPFDIIDNQRL